MRSPLRAIFLPAMLLAMAGHFAAPAAAQVTRAQPIPSVQQPELPRKPRPVRARGAPVLQAIPALPRPIAIPKGPNGVQGLVLDQEKLRGHVMRPANIVGVISDDGRNEGRTRLELPVRPGRRPGSLTTPELPKLYVNTFGTHSKRRSASFKRMGKNRSLRAGRCPFPLYAQP